MFVLQLGALLARPRAARRRLRPPRPSLAWLDVLAAGATSFLSCWMGAILKDGQMVGALAAATGIVGWSRLQERRLPAWAGALALILLLYALLVRANAVFAVVPLGLRVVRLARPSHTLEAHCRCARGDGPDHRGDPSGQSGPVRRPPLGRGEQPARLRYRRGRRSAPEPATWRAFRRPSGRGWRRKAATAPRSGISSVNRVVRPIRGSWPNRKPAALSALGGDDPAPSASLMRRTGSPISIRRCACSCPPTFPDAMSPVDPEPNGLGIGNAPSDTERAFRSVGAAWTALPFGWPAFWLALALVALWPAARAASEPGARPRAGLAALGRLRRPQLCRGQRRIRPSLPSLDDPRRRVGHRTARRGGRDPATAYDWIRRRRSRRDPGRHCRAAAPDPIAAAGLRRCGDPPIVAWNGSQAGGQKHEENDPFGRGRARRGRRWSTRVGRGASAGRRRRHRRPHGRRARRDRSWRSRS